MKPPSSWSWKRFLYRSWPLLAQVIVFNVLTVVTDEFMWAMVSTGFSLGWMIAAISAYRQGMNDREEIIRNVFGEDWRGDIVLGQVARRHWEDKAEEN